MSGISAFNHTGDFLATVVDSLDTQILRIQSGNLQTEDKFISIFPIKSINKGLLISIEWIGNGSKLENLYLGLCFNSGVFAIYSPVLNELIELNNNNNNNKKFGFANCLNYSNDKLYSFNNDNKELSIYDCERDWSILDNFKIDFIDEKVNLIKSYSNDKLILGTHCIYIFNLIEKNFISIPSHVSKLTNIIQFQDFIITIAKNDRFINMIKLNDDLLSTSSSISKIFVCDSNVLKIDLKINSFGKSIMSCITEDGEIEIFNDILSDKLVKSNRRKIVSSVKKDSKLKLIRDNNSNKLIELNNIKLIENELLISYYEENNILLIERLKWTSNDEEYLLNEDKEIFKKRELINLQQQFSKFGHDKSSNKLYNESHAVVMQGDDFQDLEEEEEDYDSFKDIINKNEEKKSEEEKNGNGNNSNGNNNNNNNKKKGSKVTLVVILNQAIRSNDDSLLEIVLNNKDEEIIRNTIKKLDSNIIIKLLNKLSEKIMRNKNRLINLNYWIKNILIYHSGWLINNLNNNKIQNLSILIRLLNDKSKNLNKLIELKGKIDILNERITIKKELNYEINELNYEIENLEDIEYIEDFEDIEEDDDDEEDIDEDIDMDEEDIDEDI